MHNSGHYSVPIVGMLNFSTGYLFKKIWISLRCLHVYLTCVFLSTDNGLHYHNTAVLAWLSEVNEVFNVNLLECNNFEAGKGKTALDTHFAHISHKIVCYVRLGNDLEIEEESWDNLCR